MEEGGGEEGAKAKEAGKAAATATTTIIKIAGSRLVGAIRI